MSDLDLDAVRRRRDTLHAVLATLDALPIAPTPEQRAFLDGAVYSLDRLLDDPDASHPRT